MAIFLLPVVSPWWAHVTVAPLDNIIAVFNKGTGHEFKTLIPTGYHTAPNSTDGDKLL